MTRSTLPIRRLIDYINESIAELYGKLVLARGDEYYAQAANGSHDSGHKYRCPSG